MIKVIALIALALALAGTGDAKDKKPNADVQAARQETRFAKLEVQLLKEQMVKDQLKPILDQEQSIWTELCNGAGLEADPKVCAVDLTAHTVTKKEGSATPEAAAPPGPRRPK